MKNNQKELRARLVELITKYPDRRVIFYIPGELFAEDGYCSVADLETVELEEVLDDRDFNERTERYWTKSDIDYIRDQIMCDEHIEDPHKLDERMAQLKWMPIILVRLKEGCIIV